MAVSKAVLVTRPRHEIITTYLCVWSEGIVELAKTKVSTVRDLKGPKATRKNLDSYLRARKPSFLFLNGHGDAETIGGHENELLLDTSTAVEGLVVYARSCDAGQVLGPALVKNPATVFIGYRRKFIFGYLPDHIRAPGKDPLAALFLESSNLVASTLLKGHTAEEAHSRSKGAMYRHFRKMISSNATQEERYASRWMWGNIRSQILLGNPKQRI